MTENKPQETPYQKAFKEHHPIENGKVVTYSDQVLPRDGKIISHSAKFENNIFSHWVYTIIPIHMMQGTHIMMTIEKTDKEIVSVWFTGEEFERDFTKIYFPYIPLQQTPSINEKT